MDTPAVDLNSHRAQRRFRAELKIRMGVEMDESDKRVRTPLAFSGWRELWMQNGDWPLVSWAFLYFASLFCSYTIMRPLRDGMGAEFPSRIPPLLTIVFALMILLVPVYGWLIARFPRRRFLPLIYLFFVGNIIVFWWLLDDSRVQDWTKMAFFVWLSVFNLFVVSIFWSYMADLFRTEQARRVYGLIAAGGMMGAIAGQLLTLVLAEPLGPRNLLLLSAAFLSVSVVSIRRLGQKADAGSEVSSGKLDDEIIGGSSWAAVRLVATSPYLISICCYMIMYTTTSTFVYLERATLVGKTLNAVERVQLFAASDLAISLLAALLQFLAFKPFMFRFGILGAVTVMPVVSCLGFLTFGLAPTLAVAVGLAIALRVGEFAIAKPAREMLFNALSREEKYKAKNLIDLPVYRGGDAAAGWLFNGLKLAGLATPAIAFAAVPISALWLVSSLWLVRLHDRRNVDEPELSVRVLP
jgi:AAA family ATP:ADP antiporter